MVSLEHLVLLRCFVFFFLHALVARVTPSRLTAWSRMPRGSTLYATLTRSPAYRTGPPWADSGRAAKSLPTSVPAGRTRLASSSAPPLSRGTSSALPNRSAKMVCCAIGVSGQSSQDNQLPFLTCHDPGFSYGTTLGATLVSMFPDKVDKVILDGVQNPHEYYHAYA